MNRNCEAAHVSGGWGSAISGCNQLQGVLGILSGKDLQPNIPHAIDLEQCFRMPVLEVDVDRDTEKGKMNEDQWVTYEEEM